MEYKVILEKVAAYTKGNPLALKVLGFTFSFKSIKVCESALRKLKKYANFLIQIFLKLP